MIKTSSTPRASRADRARAAGIAVLLVTTGFFAAQPLSGGSAPRGHADGSHPVPTLSPVEAWRAVSTAPICGVVPLRNCPLTQLP